MRMSIPIMGTSSFLGKLRFLVLAPSSILGLATVQFQPELPVLVCKGGSRFPVQTFPIRKILLEFDPELVTLSWEEQVPLEPIIGQVFQVSPLFNSSQKRVVQPFPSQKILLDLETSQASIGKNRFQQNRMRNYQASYWKEWIMGIDFSGIGSLGIWRLEIT